MAARYYPVSPLFWCDSTVRAWGPEQKLLALYLLTCEHRNLEGLYRLPKAYIAADLGWTIDDVERVISELITDGFVEYDEAAQVVFVRNALKYQAPKSDKQIKGALNSLQGVPATPLLDLLVEASGSHAPRLATALREALIPVSHTHSNGSG